MASEANELTFVRCPTCRSLVPASAARCRICNASLEAKKDSDNAQVGPTDSGRVRQRTVSAKPEEVEKITAGVTGVGTEDENNSKATSSTSVDFDPLGAFLDELDAGDSEYDELAENGDASQEDAKALEGFPSDGVDASRLGGAEEAAVEDSFVDNGATAAMTEVKPQADTVIDERSLTERGTPSEAQSSKPSAKQAGKPHQKNEVSTSGDRHLAPRGVKPRFGSKLKRQDRPERERSAQKDRNRKKQGVSPKSEPVIDSGSTSRNPTHSNIGKQQERETQRTESQRQVAAVAGKQNAKPAGMLPNDGSVPNLEQGSRRGKMRAGRLSGWLVSYENRDGRAIELRAGRFFITGTSIRDSDLILEDQSMSTPHALVSITDSGLLIQDLMSERGTFIRSQGDAQYRREESIIEVQHGDWIRFGDVEFLVVLVPE
jgi:hypothetical protein